jgi:hypothetical protein
MYNSARDLLTGHGDFCVFAAGAGLALSLLSAKALQQGADAIGHAGGQSPHK